MKEDLESSLDRRMRGVAKAGLRRSMQALRTALPVATRRAHAATICARVIEAGFLEGARSIALYRAIVRKGEIDVAALDEAARVKGLRVAYPTMIEPEFDPRALLARGEAPPPPVMEMHFVDRAGDDAFADRGRGFLEPIDGERAEASALDVVIVPGLAFDPRGHRLGYGGGNYDRLLAALAPSARAVGVAYDFQIVDEVADEPHDVAVRHLATEKRVLACDSS